MSRGPQVRSARVLRFGLSSLVALVGSVAEEFEDCNILSGQRAAGAAAASAAGLAASICGLFGASSERAQGVLQRRRMGLSGTRRPHLCAGCMSRWFHVDW